METRRLPDASEPSTRRRSTSVLIRLVVEPGSGEGEPRLRVDAVELNGTRQQNFSTIALALAWLGAVLESRAAAWGHDDDLARGAHVRGSRTQ